MHWIMHLQIKWRFTCLVWEYLALILPKALLTATGLRIPFSIFHFPDCRVYTPCNWSTSCFLLISLWLPHQVVPTLGIGNKKQLASLSKLKFQLKTHMKSLNFHQIKFQGKWQVLQYKIDAFSFAFSFSLLLSGIDSYYLPFKIPLFKLLLALLTQRQVAFENYRAKIALALHVCLHPWGFDPIKMSYCSWRCSHQCLQLIHTDHLLKCLGFIQF